MSKNHPPQNTQPLYPDPLPLGIPPTWYDKHFVWLWTWRDGQGGIIGYTARYESDPDDDGHVKKKVIPFFKRDGDEWQSGYADGPRPLFNMDGLAAAADSATLYVVEGEKCTVVMTQCGLLATTWPGGANAVDKACWQYIQRFRRVCLLPDNDNSGEDAMLAVAEILAGLPGSREVTIHRLPDLPPDGGDVVDFMQQLRNRWGDRVMANERGTHADWDGYSYIPREPGEDIEESLLQAIEDCAEPITLSECQGAADSSQKPGVELVCLADVEPEAVRWLWPGYLPRGKVVICDGDPGLGKSTATLDIAAIISTGRPFPECTERRTPENVIIVSAEDHEGDTIRPRLDAAGADVSRVFTVPLTDAWQVRLDGEDLTRLAKEKSPALIVIDPLMAFLGKADSHKDQDIREVLSKMAALAQESGAAILCIRHLNKVAGGRALYRGGGSIGIVGAARLAWLVGQHPDNAQRRVLAISKSNLAERAPSLSFSLSGLPGCQPRIQWHGEVPFSADDLVAEKRSGTRGEARAEAQAFLLESLRNGPIPSKELREMSDEAGLTWRTVNRAKADVGATSKKEGRPGEKGQQWIWRLNGAPKDDNFCEE